MTAAVLCACGGGEPSPVPVSHEGVGIIKGVKSEGKVLIIEHGDIPGFMEAMTMPFALENASVGLGFKAGDKIRFTLTEKGGDWPITKIVAAK